jgi:hypothetical protein
VNGITDPGDETGGSVGGSHEYSGEAGFAALLRLSWALLVAALILSAWPVSARADAFTTFNLAGTFQGGSLQNPPSGNFSAAITIDTTSGVATSFSVTDPSGTFGGAVMFTYLLPDISGGFALNVKDSSGDQILLSLLQSSLVGVTNLTPNSSALGVGNIDNFLDGTFSSDPCFSATCYITSVSITPAPSVPEPRSMALLGAGFVATIVARRKRG